MTRRLLNLLELWLSLAHGLVPVAAFGVAGYIRFATGLFPKVSANTHSYYLVWVLVVTLVWMLVVKQLRLNRIEQLTNLHTGVKMTTRAIGYTMVVVLTLLFFYRHIQFSRIFVLIGCILMLAMSLLVIYFFRTLVVKRRGPFRRPLRIAVVGGDEYALRVARNLKSHPLVAVEVACFVSVAGAKPIVEDFPVVEAAEIEDIVDMYRCSEVLVALPIARFNELNDVLRPLRQLCVPVRLVLDMDDGVFVPERIFSFYGLPLLDVRPYPVDSMSYVIGKRIFDIVFAAVALTVFGPLMALIAAAIKLTSPGPAIFAQERVSLNGTRFKMLKFRTMHVQDSITSDKLHTLRGDPRITRLGQLLRKTSLDEYPQFFNVLMGDMSVVGPRPELTFFVQKFRHEIPAYMARRNMKCGITGLAQVSGLRGSDTSIRERTDRDLYYLQHWSMLLDLKIILHTFKSLTGKSAF